MGLMGPPVFPQDLQMLHTGQMHECGRCWGFQVKMGFVDTGHEDTQRPVGRQTGHLGGDAGSAHLRPCHLIQRPGACQAG